MLVRIIRSLFSFNKLFLLLIFSLALSTLALTACHQERSEQELIVGTMAGPETDLMRIAANVAKKKHNLSVQIMEFEDYIMPNTALSEGHIDANLFQHALFLEKTIAAAGYRYKLAAIGKGFVYPMGLYSKKWHKLNEIPEGAHVAIPVDPSNSGRALHLLAKTGLITLSLDAGLAPDVSHIVENPKQLKIDLLDAASLARLLTDVDLAAINTNFALPAGLSPSQDALAVEGKDSPYANILVVRTKEQLSPKYHQLLEALHSPEVLAKAQELFLDQAVPAW